MAMARSTFCWPQLRWVKPEIGRMDAGYGVFLRGDGKGGFTARRAVESGFLRFRQARDIRVCGLAREILYVVTRNNDGHSYFVITAAGGLHGQVRQPRDTATSLLASS